MIASILFLIIQFCNFQLYSNSNRRQVINYLALGDSYTIGESVMEKERWPNYLSKEIKSKTGKKVKTTIIAKTGWTTDELIHAVNDTQLDPAYDLVSLLIGVNNQYRGYDTAQYREEFVQLLEMSVRFASGNKSRVFVVSIPDYGVTPFAEAKDPGRIARDIDQYNRIAEEICDASGVSFISITEISRMATSDPSLIAEDGLHPSGKMYRKWVEKVLPFVLEVLK